MAILKIKSGGRGRPLTIDTNKLFESYEKNIHRAASRLAQIREQTQGYRGEALLGSYTQLPDFAYESLDILDTIEQGGEISIGEAKQLRENIRTIERLASKQERVYRSALADKLEKEFFKALENSTAFKGSRNIAKKILKKYKQENQIKTKQEAQEFFLSRKYQDPRAVGRYKRVKDWAEAKFEEATGESRTLTYEESWAILLADKAGVNWQDEL